MTAGPSIDPARFLNEQLSQASPDLMRDLLTTFVNALPVSYTHLTLPTNREV